MPLRHNLIVVTAALTAVFMLLVLSTATQSHTAVAGGSSDTFTYLPMIVNPIPDVQITLIVYNPAGDDVAGEYVRIENKSGSTAVLTGWTLSDNDSHVYNFPSGFSLAPGAAVQVWVKSGANNATNLYWGSAQAFWNNTGGDTAYLRIGTTLVDSCSYPGGGVQVSC